ncbi:30S ribosomal protein S4 [Candidatus Hepatoplasma crinochetorum]|jgi:small subunit ribosomal protein S4|uniref:Small ribosomal subunit protein uS4 n=1 Tax=Candidatus Hepatoplasma crinochetorum Av TaxID=1427984 RepID=W8GSS0_9MOLU|nr:30S ribosomal protein S4 [Candidatus Hepatoplasma crinochetorum]AHK22450.1 ribosomal protein S4 [Candidatus Hepatoplasma crinochetorum Av]BDV03039.1 MAG: 30S ribosomal protein S4 [Candidatus Hepatoplasma crinochetorum]
MSRYTGPNNKKARRYKYSILENNKEFLKGKKKISIPGQHGNKNQKLSNYGEHLYEKQKVRYMYGLNEKQMKRTFEKATKMKGVLGENFLFLLESRLDNLIYRMGFASTRRQARQFVNHGHVRVNDRKVDIPSYVVSPGSKIELKDKSKKINFIKDNLEAARIAPFVKVDSKTLSGEYLRLPKRNEISGQLNESLVVEFYNR